MRFLFTADVQADFENLDLCERMSQDIWRICNEKHLEGFVVAGDLKRAYNPVDVRVTQFWMQFIARSRDRNLRVILLLGNHDRVGMYTEAQNWLPILREAGAEVVHKGPRRIEVDDGMLYCLPFTSSVETTRKWAKELAGRLVKGVEGSVLVFHNDIAGGSYNVLGHSSTSRLRLEDLRVNRYHFCLGGHVHLNQQLGGNTYYIGSPFCSDWGEANQAKGYMVLVDGQLDFVRSSVPHWYDPSWPRFPKKKDVWIGDRIRIHVPIEVGKSYVTALDAARQEAERKYAGATIYTVPEFKEAPTAEVKIKLSDPDAVKIRAYVDETLTDTLYRHQKAIVSYLLYKLNQASEGLGLRSGGKVDFIGAKARRFLSFKDLEVDYQEPGLRLVIGKNKDWLGRSNGSGKTNYQSPVPVALFGTTFKGQKHDAWALRGSKKPAWVQVKFRDSKGRVIRVLRGRRPGKLQLFIDGKDQSSGLQSTSKTGTQGLIERLSGFTWQTLANAVYIDQQQVNTFLSGTPSEQKKILERFQNLERFSKALEYVNNDLHLNKEALENAESEKAVAAAEVKGLQRAIGEKAQPVELEECTRKLKVARKALETVRQKRKDVELRVGKKVKRLKALEEHLEKDFDAMVDELNDLRTRSAVIESKVTAASKLYGKPQCPTCLQPVSEKHLQDHIKEWKLELGKIESQIWRLTESSKELDGTRNEVLGRINKLMEVVEAWEAEEGKEERTLSLCIQMKNSAERYWREEKDKRKSIEARIRSRSRAVEFWTKQIKILTEERAITDYCSKAFSRNGVPSFLNAQMCEPLNRAADEYSEIFTDKEIQVRFRMVDAEFEVEVVNAHGGQGMQDQSAGEKKMAAIIASFALRSVAAPCNLLVLDEPGDGLDSANAKAFAIGLKKLKGKLGTILLTSHNPVILGELSGETSVVIEKEGGVSTCMPSN